MLQLGATAEIADLDLDAVFGEKPFLDADIERQEGPQRADRFPGADLVGRVRAAYANDCRAKECNNGNGVIASEAKQSRFAALPWIASWLRSSQ